MSIFDKFKPKKEEPQSEEPNLDGWKAIENAFAVVYPDQDDRKHYGTLIPWHLGGNDPLDGISVYDGGDCWHFVTFGLSELYEKETDDAEYSGYGMEFTLRLKKGCYDAEDEEDEIRCIAGIFQKIAKITFNSSELFQANEYLYTGQKTGMDVNQRSKITGFIMIADTKVEGIDTPNGRVDFVEFIGVTDDELVRLKNKELTVNELYRKLGSDITDYNRKSVFS